MIAALRALVARIASKYDERALYRAKVLRQTEDNRVEIEPEDPRYPTMTVPIRGIAPGVRIKVTPGSVVLFGFENGDLQRPMATLWDAGGGLLELVVGDGEGQPVARVGDACALSIPTVMATVTRGVPPNQVVTVEPVTILTPIVGSIATGSAVVKVTR